MTAKIPEGPANASPQEILRLGVESAGGPVALACSFSVEDVVIIDMAKVAGIEIGVFALDTGRLNEETYEVADAVAERYRVKSTGFSPGMRRWKNWNGRKVCFPFANRWKTATSAVTFGRLRPLSRALKELAGWITGLRRCQSVTRGELNAVESGPA